MDTYKKFMPLWIIAVLCLGLALSTLSKKSAQDAASGSIPATLPEDKEDDVLAEYDFSAFSNVEIIGVNLDSFDNEQLSVLYQQARYCQAMAEPDTAAMREIISADMIFTHMSGRQQSREEYLADVENRKQRHFTIGIENPAVDVDGDLASVTFTSILNANAYEAIALAEREKREPILMEHFSPHCLRHSFATRAFENGLPPKTVQTIMGHSSTSMTLDIYTHTTERKKREDMDKLAGVFTV